MNGTLWELVRAHLCTLAVAMSASSAWRVPAAAARGGLQFLLAYSATMIVVALPVALLQLATGQLSQQDTVGTWSAVPFFKGVGYLRLVISFMGSVYNLILVALAARYFLYTLSDPNTYLDCIEQETRHEYFKIRNELCAPQSITLTSIAEVPLPEYYVAVALIVITLWISLPFVLYSPVKCMKRIFYAVGPVVLLLLIIVASAMGHRESIAAFYNVTSWKYFDDPTIWHAALSQALWSSQTAGGYLVSASGTVYFNTDVQWTAVIFIASNIIASWFGTMVWFSVIGTRERVALDSGISPLMVLYHEAARRNLSRVWPNVMFVAVMLSGIISLLVGVFPLYDRFRRFGKEKWRFICVATSFVGIFCTLTILSLRLTPMRILEDIVTPYFISFATIVEVAAFVCIYGWKILVKDIEFLTGRDVHKLWVVGWWAAPAVTVSVMTWWTVTVILNNSDAWTGLRWETIAMIVAAASSLLTVFLFASVTVCRQVQYDYLSKLISAFRPSRHWGPRDPLTHYCWLTQREESKVSGARRHHHRRHLGQFSGRRLRTPSASSSSLSATTTADQKRRANSDDLVYTICRRQYLQDYLDKNLRPCRPASLDRGTGRKSERDLEMLTFLKLFDSKSFVIIGAEDYSVSHDPR